MWTDWFGIVAVTKIANLYRIDIAVHIYIYILIYTQIYTYVCHMYTYILTLKFEYVYLHTHTHIHIRHPAVFLQNPFGPRFFLGGQNLAESTKAGSVVPESKTEELGS